MVLGFTGQLCEININECKSDPCQKGFMCIDLIDGYNCQCPQGRVGEKCEKG